MRIAKWLGMTTAAVLVLGGVMVLKANAAGARGARAGLGQQPLLARAAERLGLSEDQKAKIKAELSADKETLGALMASMHDARVNLRSEIQKPGATENEIRGASARVAAVEADLAVERAKLYGRISSILTAEQLA